MSQTYVPTPGVTADEEAQSLREQVTILTQRLSEMAADAGTEARVQTDQVAGSIDDFAYSKPYAFAACAVAFGFCLGVIWGRR